MHVRCADLLESVAYERKVTRQNPIAGVGIGSAHPQRRRVTFEGGYNARPRLSGDGSRLAVVTTQGGGYRIGVQDLVAGGLRTVTEGPNDESPAFAPNGQWLVYAARRGGRGVLATVAVDSGARSVLSATAADIRSPTWGRLP